VQRDASAARPSLAQLRLRPRRSKREVAPETASGLAADRQLANPEAAFRSGDQNAVELPQIAALEQPARERGEERQRGAGPNGNNKASQTERKPTLRRRRVPDNDHRPTIRLCANDIERIVDETEDALIKADRGLYQRDGKIVCVDTIAAIAAKGVQVYVQRICERGDHALREDLCAAAVFQKYDARSKGIWGPEGGQARVTWKIVGGGVVSAHRRPKQATR
jgi:hypothetical protein